MATSLPLVLEMQLSDYGAPATGALLDKLKGHYGGARSITWSPDGHLLASSSEDTHIQLWSPKTGRKEADLEAHTDTVISVSFSSDGIFFGSKSHDGSVRLWRCDTWEVVAILAEPTSSFLPPSIAFHPKDHVLATLGERDTVVRIWDLDDRILLGKESVQKSVHYTTAKIALVGDSGVGKTGLGWRLAHNQFKEHASTHGQQFWVINELGTKRTDGTECEAVLWDLAGQPDYRLVHSLFLDDVDLPLLLFDPTYREQPLSGVEFWLKQLSVGRNRSDHGILVGARTDRGAPTLTHEELNDFCEQNNISGGYIATSAKEGDGLVDLIQRIKAQIPWDDMPATITTQTFKRIKGYVLSLKEDTKQNNILVSPRTLRQRLTRTDSTWEFSSAEMMTAVRHLANHGYVTILRSASDDVSILLFPDILVNLAASFVLEARRNQRGLGSLEEEVLLSRGYPFPELDKLTKKEQETLLDAAAILFLEHNVCFRETLGDRTFLVFPSLINEKRPRLEAIETFDDVSYRVSGAVENVYAALVVLLGYTNTFTRTHQWQNQAQYALGEDEICGFRQIVESEGEVELVLYYGTHASESTRSLFQGLFEGFLNKRDISITRFPPIICSKCQKRQERSVIINQMKEDLNFLFCNRCGKKLKLPKTDAVPALPSEEQEKIDQGQAVAKQRTTFAAALVRIKSLRRGKKTAVPSCFMSYAWGKESQEKWVLTLVQDLRNAGINVIFDRWHNLPGTSITKFIERIKPSNYILAVGTPQYLEKYNSEDTDPVVDAEIRLVNTRIRKRTKERESVIPLLLEGEQETAFPALFEDSVFVDFREENDYFVKLFDLILTLYNIPFDNPGLDELRESMH